MSTNTLSVTGRLQALSTCPVFARIPSEDLRVLAEMMETERLAAGEVLFEHGDPADRVCLVASGRLNVFLPGKAEPVRSLGPGELLGEYAMFSGFVRTATVKAETETVLFSLDYPRLRAFLTAFPESTLVLLTTAVERLVAAETRRDKV